MFNLDKHRRRRVFIKYEHGTLAVRIERNSDRPLYITILLAFTAAFVFFMTTFIRPFFRDASIKDFLYVSPFLAFLLVWYVIGLRVTVWRAFGVEEVLVKGGFLQWTRTALFWTRKLEVPAKNVADVKAITPWHTLSNRVEFSALGRRRAIGDMLLRDEATELAHELRRAVGVSG